MLCGVSTLAWMTSAAGTGPCQRVVEFLERGGGGAAVAVEDVVARVRADRGGEVLDGLRVVPRAERGVAQGLYKPRTGTRGTRSVRGQ